MPNVAQRRWSKGAQGPAEFAVVTFTFNGRTRQCIELVKRGTPDGASPQTPPLEQGDDQQQQK
jgi:hypothetical protein